MEDDRADGVDKKQCRIFGAFANQKKKCYSLKHC